MINKLQQSYSIAEVIDIATRQKNCNTCYVKKYLDKAWDSNAKLVNEIKLLQLRYGKNVKLNYKRRLK